MLILVAQDVRPVSGVKQNRYKQIGHVVDGLII